MKWHIYIVAAVVIVLGIIIGLAMPSKQASAEGMQSQQQQQAKDSQRLGQKRAEMMKWASDWDS